MRDRIANEICEDGARLPASRSQPTSGSREGSPTTKSKQGQFRVEKCKSVGLTRFRLENRVRTSHSRAGLRLRARQASSPTDPAATIAIAEGSGTGSIQPVL